MSGPAVQSLLECVEDLVEGGTSSGASGPGKSGEGGVGGDHEGDVAVPDRPEAAFEVGQAQGAFDIAAVVIDGPACLG